IYDLSKPTSTVTSPNGSYFKSLVSVSGSATDNLGNIYNNPSMISTSGVQLAMKSVSSNWWNGTNFTGSDPTYSTFTVTNTTTVTPNTWTVSVPANVQSALVTGQSYRFVSRATDQSGNPELGPLATDIPATVGVTLLFDNLNVTSTITYPTNNNY